MKTMKLALGTLSGILALALLGGRAQAQNPRVRSRDDARGGVSTTVHPIIYEHEVTSPSAPPRILQIHADGTLRLVETSATRKPLASDRLDTASLAALKGAISAAAGDAGGPATRDAARTALEARLDALAAALARSAVVASR